MGVVPFHVPAVAVSVWPTITVPEIEGGDVLDGGVVLGTGALFATVTDTVDELESPWWVNAVAVSRCCPSESVVVSNVKLYVPCAAVPRTDPSTAKSM